MRSGRSSSDPGRGPGPIPRPAPWAQHLVALALALLAGGSAAGFVPDAGEGPAQGSPPVAAPRLSTCPRCGYLCDPSWRYCVRCGWDQRILVGEAAERRLDAVTSSVVRIVVVKNLPGMQQILSPKDYERARRYITWNPGSRKGFATAVPFLERGIFVTNARSLTWADSVEILTRDNTRHSASILGYDLASGIGVLRADVPGVEPIAPVAPGVTPETVWAVCYPIVFDEDLVRYLPVSLHRGRVTGSGESGTYLASQENLLRSDHTIPQGCLGGAIIDSRGDLAGMILGSPDAGITYSMPARDVAPIAEGLARGEPLKRPYFGIGLVAADERRRARFGITQGVPHPLVGFLVPGSPASVAGILPGDFLASVGGDHVATVAAAGARLMAFPAGGSPVTLTLIRDGRDVPITVTPAARPRRIILEPADELQEGLEANLVEVVSGPTTQQGLKVVNLVRGGRGEDSEFKEGDIIVEVNGKGVRRLETLNQIVRSQNPHIFGTTATDGDTYNTYRLSLWVRARGEARETREYFSRFPDFLAPPVY